MIAHSDDGAPAAAAAGSLRFQLIPQGASVTSSSAAAGWIASLARCLQGDFNLAVSGFVFVTAIFSG
jgi:hypothetical protein